MEYDIFIGVSLYNMMHLLEAQIKNLKEAITSSNLNIKLVYFDDGSIPKKVAYAETICKCHGISLVKLDHHGFGSVCNQIGYSGSRYAPYIMHLDSDCFLPTYFFKCVLQMFKLGQLDLGVFSFKSIKITEQFALNMLKNSDLDNITLSQDYLLPEEATQLATYAFIFRSGYYEQVGGFNDKYQAYYSDSDFCCRMASEGYKNYRIHFPQVFHVEHSTIGHKDNDLDADALRRSDLELFIREWGTTPEEMEKNLI